MFAKAARAFPAILLRNGGVLSAAGLSLKCRGSSAQCMEGDGEGHVRDRGGWQRHSGKSLADQFPLGRILNAPDPAGDAGPQALAKLKEIHKLSADAYGRIGEKGFRLWHPALYQWAVPRAAVEAVHPCAFLMCLGHAGVSCLMGAPIDGQPANPSPSSLVLAHLGQDSVGKSKHTNIIRRLLCGVESLANGKEAVPGEPDENDDDDDDDEVEVRPARREKGKPKARVDMAPQVFTGSGLLKVCGKQNLHRSPMFVLDEGLGALTQLGLTGAPDKVPEMILEYQAMFTSLWSTGTFRKDLAKGVYLLPWACPSMHMNIHPSYYIKALLGTAGRDCTAVRRRIVLYSFQPFFPHNVVELWAHYQATLPPADRQEYKDVVGKVKDFRHDQVQRLHLLHSAMFAIPEENRQIKLTDDYRAAYDDLVLDSSQLQEKYMYVAQHCVSVFGKMPEQCLRLSLVPWCAEYAAGLAQARFNAGVGPLLEKRHFLTAVDLYAMSVAQELALMDVIDAVPAGLASAPLSLAPSTSGQPMTVGYGLGGAMVQGSAKTDREIAKLTFEGHGREEVHWRVLQNWRQPKSKDFAVKKEQWEAVMESIQASWPRLGALQGVGTTDSRFVFNPWVEDGSHEEYVAHHAALVQACRLPMSAFTAARKKHKHLQKARPSDGGCQRRTEDSTSGVGDEGPRRLLSELEAVVDPAPAAVQDSNGAAMAPAGIANAAGWWQSACPSGSAPAGNVWPARVVPTAGAVPAPSVSRSGPALGWGSALQAPVAAPSSVGQAGMLGSCSAPVRPSSAASFASNRCYSPAPRAQADSPQSALLAPAVNVGTRKRLFIRGARPHAAHACFAIAEPICIREAANGSVSAKCGFVGFHLVVKM